MSDPRIKTINPPRPAGEPNIQPQVASAPTPAVPLDAVLNRVRHTYKPEPPAGFDWRPGERERLDAWNAAVASIERWLVERLAASPSSESEGK